MMLLAINIFCIFDDESCLPSEVIGVCKPKGNVFINEGEKVYYFYCEDAEKLSCIILLALDRNGLNKNEMEIMYSNAKIKYELK